MPIADYKEQLRLEEMQLFQSLSEGVRLQVLMQQPKPLPTKEVQKETKHDILPEKESKQQEKDRLQAIHAQMVIDLLDKKRQLFKRQKQEQIQEHLIESRKKLHEIVYPERPVKQRPKTAMLHPSPVPKEWQETYWYKKMQSKEIEQPPKRIPKPVARKEAKRPHTAIPQTSGIPTLRMIHSELQVSPKQETAMKPKQHERLELVIRMAKLNTKNKQKLIGKQEEEEEIVVQEHRDVQMRDVCEMARLDLLLLEHSRKQFHQKDLYKTIQEQALQEKMREQQREQQRHEKKQEKTTQYLNLKTVKKKESLVMEQKPVEVHEEIQEETVRPRSAKYPPVQVEALDLSTLVANNKLILRTMPREKMKRWTVTVNAPAFVQDNRTAMADE